MTSFTPGNNGVIVHIVTPPTYNTITLNFNGVDFTGNVFTYELYINDITLNDDPMDTPEDISNNRITYIPSGQDIFPFGISRLINAPGSNTPLVLTTPSTLSALTTYRYNILAYYTSDYTAVTVTPGVNAVFAERWLPGDGGAVSVSGPPYTGVTPGMVCVSNIAEFWVSTKNFVFSSSQNAVYNRCINPIRNLTTPPSGNVIYSGDQVTTQEAFALKMDTITNANNGLTFYFVFGNFDRFLYDNNSYNLNLFTIRNSGTPNKSFIFISFFNKTNGNFNVSDVPTNDDRGLTITALDKDNNNAVPFSVGNRVFIGDPVPYFNPTPPSATVSDNIYGVMVVRYSGSAAKEWKIWFNDPVTPIKTFTSTGATTGFEGMDEILLCGNPGNCFNADIPEVGITPSALSDGDINTWISAMNSQYGDTKTYVSGTATTASPPDPDTPVVTAVSVTQNSIQLSWTPVQSGVSYMVRYSESPSTFTPGYNNSAAPGEGIIVPGADALITHSHNVEGLSVDTQYYFNVYAFNTGTNYIGSNGNLLTTGTYTEGPPIVPGGGITLDNAQLNSIDVAFGQASDNITTNQNNLTYNLVYRKGSTNTITDIASALASPSVSVTGGIFVSYGSVPTTVTFTDPAEKGGGVKFWFAVVVQDDSATGPYQSLYTAEPITTADPTAPTGVTTTVLSDTTIQVDWASSGPGVEYMVRYRSTAEAALPNYPLSSTPPTDGIESATGLTAFTHIVGSPPTPLDENTEYHIAVYAYGPNATPSIKYISDGSAAVTPATRYTDGPPIPLTDVISLTWMEVVTPTDVNSINIKFEQTTDFLPSAYTDQNLLKYTLYYSKTQSDVEGGAASVIAKVGVGVTKVNTSPEIYGAGPTLANASTSGVPVNFIVAGETGGGITFFFTVIVEDRDDINGGPYKSLYQNIQATTAFPSAPTGVIATLGTNTTMDVAWTAPPELGVKYMVRYLPAATAFTGFNSNYAGLPGTLSVDDLTGTSHTVGSPPETLLTENTEYNFNVFAYNESLPQGNRTYVSLSTATHGNDSTRFTEGPPIVPSPPAISSLNPTLTTINITFIQAADNYTPALKYTLCHSTNISDFSSNDADIILSLLGPSNKIGPELYDAGALTGASGAGITVTVSGGGVTTYFTVVVDDESVNGGPYKSVYPIFSTQTADPVAPVVDYSGVITDATIGLTWTPTQPDISYIVKYKKDFAFTDLAYDDTTFPPDGTDANDGGLDITNTYAFTVEELDPNSKYYFNVYAYNAALLPGTREYIGGGTNTQSGSGFKYTDGPPVRLTSPNSIITGDNFGTNSMDITGFNPTTDFLFSPGGPYTDTNDLEYRIVYSENEIDTLNKALAATIVQNYNTYANYATVPSPILPINVTGLSSGPSGKDYYFTVIVRDSSVLNGGPYYTFYEDTLLRTTPPDITPPLGFSISKCTPADTSVTLTYSATTDPDNGTLPANLKYLIAYNIGTPWVHDHPINTDINAAETAGLSQSHDTIGTFNTYAPYNSYTTIVGLAEKQEYNFYVIAKDGSGNRRLTQVFKCITLDVSPPVPTPDSILTVSPNATTSTSVDVSFNQATDSTDPVKYQVVYRPKLPSPAVDNGIIDVADADSAIQYPGGYQVYSALFPTPGVTITDLTPGVSYWINVVAQDGVLPVPNKRVYTSFLYSLPDNVPPVPGTPEISCNAMPNSIDVTFKQGSDNITAKENLKYTVVYSKTPILSLTDAQNANEFTTDVTYLLTDPDPVTVSVTGLDGGGQIYYFSVLIKDEATPPNESYYPPAGDSNKCATKDEVEPVLPTPPMISCLTKTFTSITISWKAATDLPNEPSTLKYKVVYSATGSITENEADTLTGGAILLQDYDPYGTGTKIASGLLSSPPSYHFRVIVKDASGNKSHYTELECNTLLDETPPVPGTIVCSDATETSIDLEWTQANDAVTSQTDLVYEVWQTQSNSTSPIITNVGDVVSPTWTMISGPFLSYATTGGSIQATPLTPPYTDHTYHFTVLVKDLKDNVNFYPEAICKTVDLTPPVPGNIDCSLTIPPTFTTIDLEIGVATDFLDDVANIKYEIRRSVTVMDTLDKAKAGVIISPYAPFTPTFQAKDLKSGTPYYFTVICKDSSGNEAVNTTNALCETVTDTDPPVVSEDGVNCEVVPGGKFIRAWWEPAVDNASPGDNLEYAVIHSKYNNINTVSNVEANGTFITNYTKSLTAITVPVDGATNYISVLVKDEAGNVGIYAGDHNCTPIAVAATASRNRSIFTAVAIGVAGVLFLTQFITSSGNLMIETNNVMGVNNRILMFSIALIVIGVFFGYVAINY